MHTIPENILILINQLLKSAPDESEIATVFTRCQEPLLKLNLAFLVVLTPPTQTIRVQAEEYLKEKLADPEFKQVARFYIDALDQIAVECYEKMINDSQFRKHVDSAVDSINKNDSIQKIQEHIWGIFFPEGTGLLGQEAVAISELRRKRQVKIQEKNPDPITDPAREIIFTSNILLTMPLHMNGPEIDHLSPDVGQQVWAQRQEKQKFWYDHPIPLGIAPSKNEILYGLNGLDNAIQFEKARGNYEQDAPVTCILSASVTHDGLHSIAKKYIGEAIQKNERISLLQLFVFTETETDQLVADVILPAAQHYVDSNVDIDAFSMFGVDGEYGRHYSFLKAITALWQILVDPEKKATFKIDLDQVFPQEVLVAETGQSMFEHFCTDLWGAKAIDHNGNEVDLDMIAGALVNEKDIKRSLFTADVPLPQIPEKISERVFFSSLPQAISTEAEMMTRYTDSAIDGNNTCLQRVHVTGGTNGILIPALLKFMPFTPSFVGRAEDQAYIMSTFSTGKNPLAYLHKPGLIMRHDKQAFAQEAIAAAKLGKIIGDYIRILYFSAYARIVDPELKHIKDFLDPFTGCFISYIPNTVVNLRFALQALEFTLMDKQDTGKEFIQSGIQRLKQAQNFVSDKKNGLSNVYQKEMRGWRLYYKTLSALANGLRTGDAFARQIKHRAEKICQECLIDVIN